MRPKLLRAGSGAVVTRLQFAAFVVTAGQPAQVTDKLAKVLMIGKGKETLNAVSSCL